MLSTACVAMSGERRDEHGATCSCESCEMHRELDEAAFKSGVADGLNKMGIPHHIAGPMAAKYLKNFKRFSECIS